MRDNRTLKSTLVFVEIDVSASQLHATSRFAVAASLLSGPCHVAATHSAVNCKIHSDAKYRTCGFCRNSITVGCLFTLENDKEELRCPKDRNIEETKQTGVT